MEHKTLAALLVCQRVRRTATLQTTGNTSLNSIDTKTPSLVAVESLLKVI